MTLAPIPPRTDFLFIFPLHGRIFAMNFYYDIEVITPSSRLLQPDYVANEVTGYILSRLKTKMSTSESCKAIQVVFCFVVFEFL
jgi:hypothetical protein